MATKPTWIDTVFDAPRALLGVVHLRALPGTPRHELGVEEIVSTAVDEARIYAECGYSGVIVENMHDRPYTNSAAAPEVVAVMAVAAREVRLAAQVPVGVQVLAGANIEAMAVAHAAGAAFIRAEGFVFGHVADEGWIDASAAELTRHRRAIGADQVRIVADIKKKHSAHAATADVDLAATAVAAEFFIADAVVVTGGATGEQTDPADVDAAVKAVEIPVMVGSGVTADNIALFRNAHALIVGSSVKHGGRWDQPLDRRRTAALADAFHRAD